MIKLSRDRLNLLIRILLAVCMGIAVLLTVIAARPAYRDFGSYEATPGIPQPVAAMWDVPAAYVTVSLPAVVLLPEDWGLPNPVCVVVRLDRGTASTSPEFSDLPPQVKWDERVGETVMFAGDDITGRDREGARFGLANGLLANYVSTKLPYRVSWFGENAVPLYENQSVGGLMCYHFWATVNGEQIGRIPFFHQLVFKVKNIALTRRPAYNFRYNSDDAKPPAFSLPEMEISDYLSRVSVAAPFAVKAMTAQQAGQREAELRRGPFQR